MASILIRNRSIIYPVCLRKHFGATLARAWFTTSQLSCRLIDRFRKLEAHTIFIGPSGGQ